MANEWDSLLGDVAVALGGLSPLTVDVSLLWLSKRGIWSCAISDEERATAEDGPTAATAVVRARLALTAAAAAAEGDDDAP